MIDASTLCSEMERVLSVCPPYEDPGTTKYDLIMSGAACDCSGVVYAIMTHYKAQSFHGSNTIYRQYMQTAEKLTGSKQLRVGMAVFKWKNDGGQPSKYRNDGIGNMHHIGIVTSISPLRIVHQSSAAGHTAVDFSTKNWQYCGKMKNVSYADNDVSDDLDSEVICMYKVRVTASSLRIRSDASTQSEILGSLPRGAQVNCAGLVDGWFKLSTADGWIYGEYVEIIEKADYIPDQPEEKQETTKPALEDRVDALEKTVAELKEQLSRLQGD